MNRIYITGDDVAQSLINAGFDLKPEDCSTLKFYQVADELGKIMRQKVKAGLAEFVEQTCWEITRK